MLRNLVNDDRPVLPDHGAEDTTSRRWHADGGGLLHCHTTVPELGKDSMFTEDAQRPVSGACGLSRFGHKPLENSLEIQFADDACRGLDQPGQSVDRSTT